MPTYSFEDDVPAPAPAPAKSRGYSFVDDSPAPAPKAKAKGFGEQLNDFIADVPRTAGRLARAGVGVVGDAADLVAAPVRGLVNGFLSDSQERANMLARKFDPSQVHAPAQIRAGTGDAVADLLGLPQPQNAGERVVDGAVRTAGNALLPIGAGRVLASAGTGAAAGVGRLLAANPVQQMVSGAAAGAAGGYTRETGGNGVAQTIAALAAGLATPLAAGKVAQLGQSAQRAAARMGASAAPAQIDITINNALNDSGVSLASLPSDVAARVRADVRAAYKVSENLDPEAIRRLADYHATGLTPTRARLTQNPADVTQQANLAKVGANSSDPAAQRLALTENSNNKQLISGLNGLGASTADDVYAGGSKVIDGLAQYDSRARTVIGKLYDRARAADGRSAALDPSAFTRRADELLTLNLRNAELPTDIRNKLNSFANGTTPLTVDTAEQFKTILAKVQRSSSDGGVRDAISHVRTALEEAPLLPGQEIGASAQMAFNRARNMHRQYMGVVEKTPALQAVRDGIEPDQFVQKFIVGGGPKANVMDVAQLKNSIKSSPEALDAIKEQIMAHLKGKALAGAADEVGKFSQSAFNKALTSIGDRKLRIFFEPEEISQLKAIGRVSSYEQVQPIGAAVNNSNTAAASGAMISRVMKNAPVLSPLVKRYLAEPVQNISVGMQAGRALDAPSALINNRLPAPLQRSPMVLSPAALLGTETEDERKRRLLAP